MSRKATGPVFILPDEPVARFSPAMESCFEMLHRAVSRGVEIPATVDSIVGLVKQLKSLYYIMRDHLEADDGISQTVAEALPEIEIGPVTTMLSSWEQNHAVGSREYEQEIIRRLKCHCIRIPQTGFMGTWTAGGYTVFGSLKRIEHSQYVEHGYQMRPQISH